MAHCTREKTAPPVCPVFGAPINLPANVLPTYSDVMKFYLQTAHTITQKHKRYRASFTDVADIVIIDVINIWSKASVPTVSHKRVVQLLKVYHTKFTNLLKPYKSRKDNDSYISRIVTFRCEADHLFDICSCKCPDTYKCTCEKRLKVPAKEIPFLLDQRGERKMMIGGEDVTETKRLHKQLKRKVAESESLRDRVRTEEMTNVAYDIDNDIMLDDDDNDDDGDDPGDISFTFPPSPKTPKRQKTQMRVKLPATAMACDRHGLSDRAAASITTAVLHDFGIVTADDSSKIIDRSKVRRSRETKRKLQQVKSDASLPGLYFDGRKDKTLVNVKADTGKYHRDEITEEHIVICREPGSTYYCHVTPESGSSKSIIKAMTKALVGKTDLKELTVVGCDGTAVNTGQLGDVIRLLELKVKRPLQWMVCLLHANELPLRHLFQSLDGATTGPFGFAGTLGKALNKCDELPVVKYRPVETDLPTVDPRDLSTDQRYLYEMAQAVSSGDCSRDLSLRNPGALNHSRWLTTANRLLRLYVGCKNPSDTLVTIVTFIVRVYATTWFNIKRKPSCKDGARHVFMMIKNSRYLTDELKAIVDPVIQRNSYFAQPENLLLSMMTDERPHIRELAIRRILKARDQPKRKGVRQFTLQPINFDCTDYTAMIDWPTASVTEPPVTMSISDDDLREFIREPITPVVTFDRYPCHTQAVERLIKVVTEASKAVCGENRRDGFIRTKLESRAKMPVFNTKWEFNM